MVLSHINCLIISTIPHFDEIWQNLGLYRDDGLGVIIKATARDIETIKKDLCVIFNKYGLKVTIEANKKISSMSR